MSTDEFRKGPSFSSGKFLLCPISTLTPTYLQRPGDPVVDDYSKKKTKKAEPFDSALLAL
jgi:hypothetical protein